MWNKIKKFIGPIGAIAAGVAGLLLGKGFSGGKQRRADRKEAKRINHDVNRGLESVQKGLESDVVKNRELGELNRRARENNNAIKSEIEGAREIADRVSERNRRIERENRKAR